MKMRVFSVYDVKAEMFSPPWVMGTIGEATRAFQDLANDANSSVSKHPGDFKLCCLGEFDNVTGVLVPAQIDSLGFASDYKALRSSDVPLSVVKGA